jgi:hypothetical protein
MITTINSNYPFIDVILITGGLVARDSFLSPAAVLAAYKLILNQLQAAFPTTQIYFALGASDLGPTQL